MSQSTAGTSGEDVIRDRERLREIVELDLTSPEVQGILDDITRKASAELDLPISLVSVVLDEAQFFAAQHGLQGWLAQTRGTPVEWSFCANAVRSREPFVVEDATTHPAVRDNPLVTQEGIRCYAGIPLITDSGHALGTLCVLGTSQRAFQEKDLDLLRKLAAEAVQRIEARRK